MKTQEGFVLPAVIFSLAIMGLLAVVSLRTANDEHRSSRALRESGVALYAAEAGANVLRGTEIDTSGTKLVDSLAATLAEGASVDLGWSTLPSGATYHAVLQRVDLGGDGMYLLTVEGRGAGPWGGQRAITMALRAPTTTTSFDLPFQGALGMYSPPTKSTDVKFSGGSFALEGHDTVPPSASDPANLPDACSAPTGENRLALELGSVKGAGEVADNLPANKMDAFKGLKPGSTTNEYVAEGSFAYDPGGMTPDDVIELAEALKPGATAIAPGSYGTDFGTPTSPEVFLTEGDLSLKGSGSGFGVLIVTGTLSISGSYTWEGLVLVVGLGIVNFSGSDNQVFGAILVASLKGGPILELGGNGGLYYSSQTLCRVAAAGLMDPTMTGELAPLSSRAWSEVMR